MPAFVCLAALAAFGSGDGQAQSPIDEQPEIVVTGERVPRTLRETASSVAVVTADMIETTAAADRLEEILSFIPNVQQGSGGEGPTIRGQDTTGAMRDLPAFLGGNRPRTTLIVDGRAVSFNEYVFGTAPLWDVERIEVFRTPQTTTQGRNSIAGAIFIHSKDPSFEWEGRARGIVAELETRQVSGTLTGPLVSDDLAVRISGDWRWQQPAAEIRDNIRGADFEHDDYGLLRVKLLARPDALPGSRVELTYTHSTSLVPGAAPVQPPFRKRRATGGAGVFRTDVDSLTASIDYELSEQLVTRTVLSRGNAKVRRFAPPGVGETRTSIDDWSGEIIVDWKPTSSLRLTGGLSYLKTALDQRIDLSVLAGIGVFDDKQRSVGLFGEANWQLSSRAELTAGLRYQHDSQRRIGGLDIVPLDYDRSFHAWLPKLSFSYEFSEALLAGILVQRAYNPGGVTLRFDTGLPDEFEAERLWNYELFARASLSGALNARINIFRAEMRDAQRLRPIRIFAPSGIPVTFADMFNVAKAHSQGAELELDWRVAPRLSARAALGLLDTKIVDPGAAPAQYGGKEFQRSPHFSAALSVDWRPVDAVRLSAQLRHNGAYFSEDANDPRLRIDASTTVNARASWQTGRVTLFGYARNLFDNFYLTMLFSPNLATAGDPQELGIGAELAF